MANACSRNM